MIIQDKSKLTSDMISQLEEIVLDAGLAEKIHQAATASMGQELSEEDMVRKLLGLLKFSSQLSSLSAKKLPADMSIETNSRNTLKIKWILLLLT